MNGLSILIGFAQMTLVLLTAGLIARALRRITPRTSASVGIVGLILSFCLLLLTLVNAPRPIETQIASPSTVSLSSSVFTSTSNIVAPPATLPNAPSIESRASVVPLSQIATWLGTIQLTEPTTTPLQQTIAWLALAAVLSLAVIAITPLLIGLCFTIKLHRDSELIDDDDLNHLLHHWLKDRNIQLRRSSAIRAPCVTVRGCNTIYLPAKWQEWPRDELHAGIAHELAHLKCGDAWKRLIAQAVTALQCFHPLAITLRRSVMLSQEVSADQSATLVIGQEYLTAISQMALRIDREIATHSLRWKSMFLEAGLVSASSSQLIRRIEMLKRNLKRPKSVSSSSIAHSRLPHVMLTGVFVLCACWTLKAEPPETTEPPSANAGPADQPAARVAALPKRISSVSHEMFSLAPLSPWESVTPNDNGFVAVRVDELLKLPVAALALPSFVEPFLDKIWDVVSTDEASESRADLGLSVRNLELIVSSMTASVSQKPAQDGEGVSHQSTIQAGENGVDIRFVNAVSHDAISNSLDRDKITDWLVSAPQGKLSIKDQTHSEFVENALGMILTDGAVTKTLSTKKDEPIEFDEAALEKLKRGWKAIDGGILASTHSFPKTLGYVDESEDAAQEDLFNRTACAGVGIDSKDGRDFSLRVALIPRDEATAADVLATMEHLIDMAKQDEGAGSTPVEIAQTALAMEFFKTLNLTIVADPHAQESKFVLMEGKLPLQAVLLLADF